MLYTGNLLCPIATFHDRPEWEWFLNAVIVLFTEVSACLYLLLKTLN